MLPEYKALLQKHREYLDYLEKHYDNVQTAWKIVQKACEHHPFVYDDFLFHTLNHEIENHDLSKFSAEEFSFYRRGLFQTNREGSFPPEEVKSAIEHHYNCNAHHWQNWTNKDYYNPHERTLNIVGTLSIVHMVVDWLAFGMNPGAKSLRDYYEGIKDQILIKDQDFEFIELLISNIEEYQKND